MKDSKDQNAEILDEFLNLVDKPLPQTQGLDVELLLQLIGTERSRSLRLCAIPHSFTPEILTVLQPEMTAEQASERCDELSEYSVIRSEDDALYLHEPVRTHLFQQWLNPASCEEFTRTSSRLSDYFTRPGLNTDPQASELARKSHMFHLLGSDQTRGFALFESQCREARRFFRFSQCQSLVRLVHEYDELLEPANKLWLIYHEGKLATDLRQWELAETFFKSILVHHHSALPLDLRIKTTIRLGSVFNEQRRLQTAMEYYQQALQITEQNSGKTADALKPLILRYLGMVHRERGNAKEAQQLLQKCIQLAEPLNDHALMATAHNSLGELYRMRGESDSAITAFNRSLDCLNLPADEFRTAQVFNNLGNAWAGLLEWQRSEDYFKQSLAIKRKAGDSLGQANALNNLARVHIAQSGLNMALDSYNQAITLLKTLRAPHQLALTTVNRARLHRRMGNTDLARDDMVTAIELYRKNKKENESREVAQELATLMQPVGLPWWAWLAIALSIFAVAIVFLFPETPAI